MIATEIWIRTLRHRRLCPKAWPAVDCSFDVHCCSCEFFVVLSIICVSPRCCPAIDCPRSHSNPNRFAVAYPEEGFFMLQNECVWDFVCC